MARWTRRQEDILREKGHLGVEAVRREILRKCGVDHSPHAIEMHAHRIKASLRLKKVCPECGAVGAPLNLRSGLCPKCTVEQHIWEQATIEESLAAERVRVTEGEELEEARREYAKIRQRNSRLRKKLRESGGDGSGGGGSSGGKGAGKARGGKGGKRG